MSNSEKRAKVVNLLTGSKDVKTYMEKVPTHFLFVDFVFNASFYKEKQEMKEDESVQAYFEQEIKTQFREASVKKRAKYINGSGEDVVWIEWNLVTNQKNQLVYFTSSRFEDTYIDQLTSRLIDDFVERKSDGGKDFKIEYLLMKNLHKKDPGYKTAWKQEEDSSSVKENPKKRSRSVSPPLETKDTPPEKKAKIETSNKDINSEYTCGFCEQHSLIPHPDRISKKHPYPEYSFLCTNCVNLDKNDRSTEAHESILVCCECKVGWCEWWYGLGEIWEDMYNCKYCYDDAVFCQPCYFKHTNGPEHKKNKMEYIKRITG